MADITWPSSGRAFAVEQYDESPEWDVEISHSRNGRIVTRALPGMRWVVTLKVPEDSVAYLSDRRQLEALLMRLRGGANRLLLWHLLTPAPLGTMRGSPTLSSTVAAGATSASISGTGTLLRGDRIGLGTGGQRVMVTADATLPASVSFEPAARAAVSSGSAVVWDKPTSRYVLRSPQNSFPARADKLPGFSVELVEE